MTVTTTPLDIERFYVRDLQLTTNAEHDESLPAVGHLDVDFEVFPHHEDQARFQVVMSIDLAVDERHPTNEPYSIHVVTHGFFRFNGEVDEERRTRLMFSNAVPILFGLTRGHVSQATAQGFFGPVLLPAVNFVELVRRKAEDKPAPAQKSIE